MPSIISLACPLRSRRRFKPWNDRLRKENRASGVNYERKDTKSGRRRRRAAAAANSDVEVSTTSSSDENECSTACSVPLPLWRPGKGWDVRRRDSRVNGADIYVARVTKNGMGGAKPCWRCLEWCRWAGVKRVFHWNCEEGRFDVVKVNGDGRENYETRADMRLFAGQVCPTSALS